MAIGNGDETEEQSQPQAFDTSCSDHKDTKVALFCQTCGILICSKCVSFHQNKHSRHRDHVYMDLVQAYDIQKVIVSIRTFYLSLLSLQMLVYADISAS